MPQIQVFQCPSCGANLSYDGGDDLTFPCQFCGTSVIVPEELRPKAPPPYAPQPNLGGLAFPMPGLAGGVPMEKLAELQRLARSGQQMQAVKLYREIFDTSLAEASQAVENLAAGQPLVITSTQVEVPGGSAPDIGVQMAEVARLARSGRQVEAVRLMREVNPGLNLKNALEAVNALSGQVPAPSARRARRVGAAVGCSSLLFVVLLLGGILAFVGAIVYLPFRLSGSYQQALEAAQSNPAVIEALGAPVKVAWWPGGGEISCGGDSCSANYDIPIQGSRNSGRIRVMSNSRGARFLNEGAWVLNAAVVVNNGPTIKLTPSPATAPTSSAVQEAATQGAMAAATQLAEVTQQAEAEATQQAEAEAAQNARQATATAVAAQAAATAAAVQATAEAVETAAAQAQAEATAQAVMAAQAAWPAVLTDKFASNQLGWPTGFSGDDYFAITTTVKAGKYAWSFVPQRGGYAHASPRTPKAYGDFSATVNVTFVDGGEDGNTAAGLVIRRTGREYGFFGIDPNGSYRISLVYPADGLQVYWEGESEAINRGPGQVNQLTARALGPDLVFQVNDIVVYQLSQDLPAGDIGLGVDARDQGDPVRLEFAAFEVHAPKK